MKPIQSESIDPMLSRRSELLRLLLIVGVAVAVIIVAILGFKIIKSNAYGRLAPVGISLEFTYVNEDKPSNQVILEYDYGYGFIPGHRQNKQIVSDPVPKQIDFSISSWKTISGLRLSTEEGEGFIPRAVSLERLGETTRILLNEVKQNELIRINNVELLLSGSHISNDELRSK